MTLKCNCVECAKPLVSGNDVTCSDCAEHRCHSCEQAKNKLYCAICAEEEFGSDDDAEPTDEDIAAFLEHAVITDDVGDLAAAISRGDIPEAAYLLDKIAAVVPGWSDRVSLGRYSPAGRAKAA